MTGTRNTCNLGVCIGVVASVLLSGAGPGFAATRTWTGGGADANWTTSANWGGTAPSAGDDLVFPGGAARLANTNDFAAGTSFNSITFNGSSGGYNLGGNGIQLVAGIALSNTAGLNVIALDIALAASQTFTAAIDRLMLGNVNLGTHTLTLNADPFPAVIEVQLGALSGTGGVIMTGAGYVYLDLPSTYSGPTTVNGTGTFSPAGLNTASVVTVNSGVLQLVNGASVGPVTVNSGAYLYLEGGGISQIANVTNLTLQAGSSLDMIFSSLSNHSQIDASGTVDLGGATFVPFWAFTSSTGNTFTLVNKTSGGAVTGTFAGLAEGATFTGSGRNYQVTYVGGDGNDVVVSDIGAAPTPTPTPTLPPPVPATSHGGLLAFLVVLAAAGFLVLTRRVA